MSSENSVLGVVTGIGSGATVTAATLVDTGVSVYIASVVGVAIIASSLIVTKLSKKQ